MEKYIPYLNQLSVEKIDLTQWIIYHTKNKLDKIVFSGALIEITLTY